MEVAARQQGRAMSCASAAGVSGHPCGCFLWLWVRLLDSFQRFVEQFVAGAHSLIVAAGARGCRSPRCAHAGRFRCAGFPGLRSRSSAWRRRCCPDQVQLIDNELEHANLAGQVDDVRFVVSLQLRLKIDFVDLAQAVRGPIRVLGASGSRKVIAD